MILAAPALASALLLASSAPLLPDPSDMGERSGRMLGAAAACGVAAKRIEAVRRASLGLIGQAGFAAAARREAEEALDRTRRETRARTEQTDCPAAIEAFELAESQ